MSALRNAVNTAILPNDTKKILATLIDQLGLDYDSEAVGRASSNDIGAMNQAADGLTCIVTRFGKFASLEFNLNGVVIDTTDATTSGSSGSVKLFDFATTGLVVPLASSQIYTAAVDSSAITTGVGDVVYVLGVGSVAANAGDGALTGTEVDYAAATATITNSSFDVPSTQKKLAGAGTAVDGSATASDIYLNWSGSAATSDANGTMTITGTITLLVALLDNA